MNNCPNRTKPPGVPENPIPPDATIDGSVTVVTQADVDALAGIRYITGDLIFGDERAERFYSAMGLLMSRESHGGGPSHYVSTVCGLVFEITR